MLRFTAHIHHTYDTILRMCRAMDDTFFFRRKILMALAGMVLAVLGVWNMESVVGILFLMIGCWMLASLNLPAKNQADNIKKALAQADLVVGAVLLPGRAAPKLVKREDLAVMKPGAVIVDVAVDQGGCVETTHATTHADPVFMVDGIVHYCVANMPGAVARTSTLALGNATLAQGLALAAKGVEQACKDDPGLLPGLNCYAGKCTCAGVAEALGLEYVDAATLI